MRRKIFLILLFFFFNLIFGEEIKIGEIKFLVDGKERKELNEFVPLKKGDNINWEKLKEGMQNLWKTDEFASIEVELLKEEKSQNILFLIKRKRVVGKITFKGEKGVSTGKLTNAITSLKKGGLFNQSYVEKAREEILSKLKENGFLDAEIDPLVRDFKGRKEVIFNIKAGKRRKIKEILIQDFLKQEIEEKLNLRKGDLFIPFKLQREIDRVLSNLKKKGYLRARLNYDFKKVNKEWVLIEISGSLGEKIKMEFKGASIPVEILTPLWEGDTLEEWALEESKIKIQKYLRSKGFLFAEVDAHAERDGDKLELVFDIKKGNRYRLHRIKFDTEKNDIKDLKKFLQDYTEPTISLWANGELIDNYENGIKVFYKDRGYSEVGVKKEILKRRNSVDVLFKIDKGKFTVVKSVSFEGNEPYRGEELKSVSGISEGALFSDIFLENAVERIRIFLMNQGYKNAKVSADVRGEREKSILFKIDKGKRFKIRKLYLSGLTRTKEFIVRKMLRIKEGDFYSYERVQATLKNLQESGIFSEIKVREIEIDNEVIIIFILREGESYHVGIGGGYLERSGPRGSIEFSHNNILGLATSGSSVLQLSPKEKRGVISLTNKSFIGFKIENITSLWWEKEERKSFTYERRGFAISSVEKRSDYSLFLLRYRIARTNLLSLSVKESAIDREYRPFYTSSLSASYLVDLRDDPFNPSRGRYWIFNIEKAFPAFGTESNFWKFSFNLQHIKTFPYDIIQNSFLRIGYIYGKASIADRFFAGGSSFRGEKVDELGPKDPETGNPIGGNIIFLANTESLLPVFPWDNLRLSVFFDLGNVFWEKGNFKLSNFNIASGIGLWYKTPVGPFKIYLGYNFTKPSLKRKGVILFNIGNEF
jgi:outer membrane protein insertion porin family